MKLLFLQILQCIFWCVLYLFSLIVKFEVYLKYSSIFEGIRFILAGGCWSFSVNGLLGFRQCCWQLSLKLIPQWRNLLHNSVNKFRHFLLFLNQNFFLVHYILTMFFVESLFWKKFIHIEGLHNVIIISINTQHC